MSYDQQQFEEAKAAVERLSAYMKDARSIEDFARRMAADVESPFFSFDMLAHVTTHTNPIDALLDEAAAAFDDHDDHQG